MGYEQRAREMEQERQAGLSPEPREITSESAPSEWLEQQARNHIANLVGQANGLVEVLNPRSPLVTPGGRPAAAPQINFPVLVLENQRRIMMGLAMVADLLLTQLTGKPELRPVGKPGNGDVPLPAVVKE